MSTIAVIGAGVSGLVAARLLSRRHEVTIFESNDYAGGHTRTVPVELAGGRWDVDTGFIVFNERAYPNFLRLLDRLSVVYQQSTMSFSVRCERTGLEYGGCGLNSLFAQRRNLFRPAFHRMVCDVLRFGREAPELNEASDDDESLLDYLVRRGYSREFIEHYAVPMGAAIWSADPEQMRRFPARYFVRFFDHHGVLDIRTAPQWYVIRGGSRRYVERLIEPLRRNLLLRTPVIRVVREPTCVRVVTHDGQSRAFDAVVLATHSDQALEMLDCPTAIEREVLGAIRYQPNDVVLHTDSRLMPRRRLAWSSWNYQIPKDPQQRVSVTYNMNMLQSLRAPETFLVSLNCRERIDPARIIDEVVMHHPVLDQQAVAAQARHAEINGADRIHYAGAYWRYGFHEDGVDSALAVCRQFGEEL